MSDISTSIVSPGEVNILKAMLITSRGQEIDIVGMISDITLYEDIFSNTMSGYIMIKDSTDLINNIPLTGQEEFELILRTPAMKEIYTISKMFYIYKLQSRVADKRAQSYKLNFCSRELIDSSNSKIAKAYKGLISDTVENIFADRKYIASDSTILVEKTNNAYSFIAPFWTPFETINWLASKSLNEDKVPNYLFYEDNKTYRYMSIDTMVKADTRFEFVTSDVDANTAQGYNSDLVDGAKFADKYNTVLSYNTDVVFDYLRNLSAGMYASKLYLLDTTTRSVNVKGFDHIKEFDKSAHLNKHPMKSERLNRKQVSSLHFVEKNNYITGSYKSLNYRDVYLQRNSLLEQFRSFKMTIEIHGRTDLKVGDTIKLKMNINERVTAEKIDSEIASKYFSGKYLITAIRHQIISAMHTMFLEIVSDSFVEKLKTEILI